MVVRTVTVIGGNLFAIAARELGDALQWVNLAQANNLHDPFLRGQVTLNIPARDDAFAHGIGAE